MALEPETEYQVRLTAQYADGSTSTAAPQNVRTLAPQPPGPRQTPGTGVMYGVDRSSDSLYTVDLTTGAWTLVGDTGINNPERMAYDSLNGVMYGVPDFPTPRGTYTVDLTTGAWTVFGTWSLNTAPDALVYDSDNDVLYGVAGTNLYSVDRTTGTWTLVPNTVGAYIGACYVPDDSLAYAITSAGVLHSADLTTGDDSPPIGNSGISFGSQDIGYDGSTIYGISNTSDSLYTVDRTTGAWTLVGLTGTTNPRGLAYAPVGAALALPSVADQAGLVGDAVDLLLPSATGGAGSYSYTATPLPAGLSFASGTQRITGALTMAQTVTVTYTVTDGDNDTATRDFDFVITQPFTLAAFDDDGLEVVAAALLEASAPAPLATRPTLTATMAAPTPRWTASWVWGLTTPLLAASAMSLATCCG